jgi:hypothetical protein
LNAHGIELVILPVTLGGAVDGAESLRPA